MDLPKTICMLPWVSIETSPIGTVRPCCMAHTEITDTSGQKYDLNWHTLKEAYDSEYMQDLRRQFRAGEKPKTCNRCWEEEAAGRDSKRINTFARLKPWIDKIEWGNDRPDQLWFIDLKLGNICNLKCRICGSWSSSKWADEELNYYPDKDKKKHIAYTWLRQGAWPRKSTVFWDNMREILPQVKYFEFTGGEPWLIQEHIELLKFAKDQGYSKNIDIHYNTNATTWPEDLVKLWPDFGRVDIAFSIDNIGARFEYERYGAKWDYANKIIDTVNNMKLLYPNITTQLCFTINIQNVLYIHELLMWAETKNFGSIYWNMLHSPDHMSVQHMTLEAKNLIVNTLQMMIWKTVYQREIDSLIKFIEAGPGSDGSEFRRKMKLADQYRNQDFCRTHPEIAKAMEYDKT